MPDFLCPPLANLERPCPCRAVRYGVALLAMSAYSAAFSTVFFGKPFAAVIGPVLQGVAPVYDWPIKWMACAVFGVLCVGGGIYRIYSEGHGFKAGSFLWSVGVVAAVLWRLTNYPDCIGQVGWFGLPIDAFDYHFGKMVLVAWAASNAANIALQLIEAWRRRPRVPRRKPAVQTIAQPPSGLLHGWSRRVTTVAWIEDIGLAGTLRRGRRHNAAPPHASPDAIEHGGDAPMIDLVRTADGSFIPVNLPDGETVRVRRRR